MIASLNRILVSLWIFCIPGLTLFSQNHSSRNNYTGEWEAPTSWNPTWAVPQTTNINNNISIYGLITRNGSLIFPGNSANLTVSDTLVIKGNLTIGHNDFLTVSDNGILIIRGNLILDDDASIDANGYLIVTGDIDKVGGTSHQYIRSNDNPVKVFIGGTIDAALRNKTWNPVFECTTEPSLPYPISGCSYGNMTDIINDPIYPFFQSTCIQVPTITATGSLTFCMGGNVTLTSTSASSSSWLWSNGATTPSVKVIATGSYSVKVTNVAGCQSTPSASIVVTVNPLPEIPVITANGPLTFCTGGSLTLTSTSASAWLWSNGATTQSINITESGNYTVKVTNANGCLSAPSAATTVTVNPFPEIPTITAGGPLTFCTGGSLTLTSTSASSWLWSNGETTQSINITESGNYSVLVTNANGCQSAPSAATTVTVNALPETPTITSDGPLTFCTGGFLTLTSASASASTSASAWLWSNGATTRSINVISSGSFTVQTSNTNGCQSAASLSTIVTVNKNPIPIAGPDQSLKFVFETQMKAELLVSENGEWSLLSGTGHIVDIHSPKTGITGLTKGENVFLWKVSNGNCDASYEVKIAVYDLFVPSVITPDGDGKNDFFVISEITENAELIIFNRWGNVEYTSGNYSNDWEGRSTKGVELPADTYFYVLKLDNGIIKKGSVLIKR